MAPEEARRQAILKFGAVEAVKEDYRDQRSLPVLDHLFKDTRYALRGLRKNPGFTVIAVLTLGLGIGANTTIFTFVNALLLRSLPYPRAEAIVILREQPQNSEETVGVHPFNYLEWRARARSFESLALLQAAPLTVIGDSGAEQISRIQVTAELFRVFGTQPTVGRAFTDEEMQLRSPGVVILGHGFWQTRFGGDPGVVGRNLVARDGSLRIVGVAPPGLRIGTSETDAYTPLRIDPAKPDSVGSRSFVCYGRLKPGVGVEAARAEMASIGSALAREYPLDRGFTVFLAGLRDYLAKDGRGPLMILMVVVATVLLIACVNLASLLLARGLGRRGEFAMRTALGASRARLVAQLVTESLVLSSLGGAIGLAIAYAGTRMLVVLSADALGVGGIESIRLDRACVLFTLAVCGTTVLLFGLFPAWHVSSVEPQLALGGTGRGSTGDRRHQRLRGVLIVAEVAMAVVLLVGAGLLLRTFSNLVSVDLGFQPAQSVTMNLFLGDRSAEARITLVDQILDRVQSVPGIKAVGTIQFLPLTGTNCGTGFWPDGQVQGDVSRALPTECSLVAGRYFDAMGIPLLEGRSFNSTDRFNSPRTVIVNRIFARRYFSNGRAVGHRILVQGSNQAPAEIIGIVGDIRHNGLTSEPAPTVFLLHSQTPGYITNLVVRTDGDPMTQVAAVRRAIHAVDRNQAVSSVKTMDEYVASSLARPRMYAVFVGSFAALAVVLAVMGVYGLLTYVVTQRTRELGIRLALGATRGGVFSVLFGHGACLTFLGLVVGIGAALMLREIFSTLLFGVTAGDPITYASAAAIFALISLAATAIPARRAARVDPLVALRYE